jgi:hypothetical protein
MARSKLNIEKYVNALAETVVAQSPQAAERQPSLPLDSVLKGLVVELWSAASGRLFIVADEADAHSLGEPRGVVYTAAELRRVVRVGDPAIVREIHDWKRKFNGRIRG